MFAAEVCLRAALEMKFMRSCIETQTSVTSVAKSAVFTWNQATLLWVVVHVHGSKRHLMMLYLAI